MAEKTVDEKLDALERDFEERLRAQFNQFLKAALATGLVVTGVLVTVAVAVAGRDGRDGLNGQDGQDALAPAGIVIASRKECKDLNPTNGWTDYSEAYGRVIVGVGETTIEGTTRKFLLQETGGYWEHQLTIEQMPDHNHPFSGREQTLSGWKENAIDLQGSQIGIGDRNTTLGSFKPQGEIGSTGGGEPHNNMPPYIALYFCKKEAG